MRILAIAYACEPDKGSEPGAGWAWSRMLARMGETWVITRSNNRESIERALVSLPVDERPRFAYVDLPDWARAWKRGQRGIRAYYLLWQIAALRTARRMQKRRRFDIVWHLTLTNIWLGSVGGLVGSPFVYGPMGGGSPSCWNPRIVGPRGLAYEVLRSLAVTSGRYLNPLARQSWRRATLILVNNEDTARWLPTRYRYKAQVFPNAAIEVPERGARHPTERVAVFAARLLHWKGGTLAIRAIQHLPEWQLVIFGTGPDEPRLRRLVNKLGVADRVAFRGWIPRDDLMDIMRAASVLLMPSVHDSAPWIVSEAITMGLPAICLDHGGPPALGATCVPLEGPDATARSLAAAVQQAEGKPSLRWNIDSRCEELRSLLERKRLLDPREA